MAKPGSVDRRRPGSSRHHGATWTAAVVGAALTVVVFVWSLTIGDLELSWSQVVDSLADRDSSPYSIVVWNLRLPRAVLAVLAGLAFAMAGALAQSLTRNPLADPGILGVNAGASLAMVLAASWWGITDLRNALWFALVGALVTTTMVYAIGTVGTAINDPTRLLLAGVAISALFGGVTSTMVQLDENLFSQLAWWTAGSLDRRGWDGLAVAWPVLLVGALLALSLGTTLDQLALGDSLSASTGVTVWRARAAVVLAVTLLAGGATAIAGPIGFVGLMVPHLARRFTGADQRQLLVLCAVLGPLLVLFSDVVGRLVLPHGELPVGVVTGLLGAPLLVVMVSRLRSVR